MPELLVLTEQLLAPVPGGTGRYTRELAAALASTAPAGWTVTSAIAKHADPSEAVVPGVDGPRVLPLPRRALVAAWERGIPLWPGGDAVHAPTPLAPPAAKRGRSLVVTVHDTVPWSHPGTLTRRGVSWHRRVVRRAAHHADAIVVPTAAVAAELSKHAPGPVRVHVIGEGVPDALLEPPPQETADEIAHRLQLPPKYVLAIGTVEPRKGLDVLIASMAKATAPPLPLIIVGTGGWGGVDPLRLAADQQLEPNRVRVLGRVSDLVLSVVLRKAAVLAVPSRAEGFGLQLLEAMALGVPVVHSDAPALVEVAGGAGVVVRREDPVALAAALRSVVDDPRWSAELAEAGRRRAAMFSWRRSAQQVWQLHRTLYAAVR